MTVRREKQRRRDEVLHEARQRLERLETEARRISETLACLETCDAGGAAGTTGGVGGGEVTTLDQLGMEVAARPSHAGTPGTGTGVARLDSRPPSPGTTQEEPVSVAPPAGTSAQLVMAPVAVGRPSRPVASGGAAAAPRVGGTAVTSRAAGAAATRRGSGRMESTRQQRRKTPSQGTGWRREFVRRLRLTPSWLASLAVHVALLGSLALLTIATLPNDEPVLDVSLVDGPETVLEELSEVEIEPVHLDEPLPDDRLFEMAAAVPEAMPMAELKPAADLLPAAGDGDRPQLGQDRGMPSAHGRGGGRAGAPGDGAGKTSFFGTAARGNRVVFLVDNSNSMDGGRFETALLELGRSVEMMSPEQFFYVIFHSDAVYRMFHPDPAPDLLPATRQNKQKLHAWLQTAQMCRGGQLVDAMRIAEEMQPQVVYLLSDGVIGDYPLKCLTEPTRQGIVVHTVGMTVPSADAARRLQAIAAANQGIFRPVGVNLLARTMALQRPIKKNRTRGPVWGIKLPGE